MLFRNPRALPALMLCIGLGLAGYRGWQLEQMPVLTPQDIEQSVELNYVIDLARSRARATDPIPVLPPDEAERRKARIRQEIINEEATTRGQVQSEFTQGVLMALCGGLLLIVVLWYERRGPGSPS